MKRFFMPLLAVAFICCLALLSCMPFISMSMESDPELDMTSFELSESYELISVEVVNQTDFRGAFSGTYLLCFGGSSGSIETTNKKIYEYWYKRSDGGIIPATIKMPSSYKDSEKIVIYEDDEVTPKIEIWRNASAVEKGDGYSPECYTEYRFTIPSGSFVNTYNPKGTQNFENSE